MSTDTRPAAPRQGSPAASRSGGRPARRRARLGNPVAGLGSLVWLVIVVVPLYTLVSASLMRQDQALNGEPLAIPTDPTLDNYRTVLDSGFLSLLGNTAIVAVVTVALVLVLSVPVAYVAVRTRSRLSSLAFRTFLLGVAIPAQAVIVPLYLLIGKMGLYDTLWAIILPTAAFSMPVAVLVLSGTMRDVSEEMYEAMSLDGATPLRMLWQLVVPLSKAGISTVAIFSALQAWNGFLFPLILTQSEENRVLTLGLFNFMTQFGVNIPAVLAAIVLSVVPIFLVYLVARRALINGLMGVGGK
ncbi:MULTISPECIES: carbohydrate ABC transporter permease [Streptomyces]|uniref:carbohydrate ABC transporter permease n=1 Tax=Streptomyces TaxID=1883 RepID=UPI00081B1EF8|nr:MULTISPECIES: carbohydrate ABC transporter permease [unclassified Streptomyces]MYQ54996.1 ABC transporter permease subunit [Streptomyces sp. SID4941]SCE31236.1 xylobiose transport system permease protein [Streptomyces sp. PalvLS-984]SDC26218.1 xylobiose transport system permease protein [Streptomyces sp. AmelKG-A3]